MKRKRVLILGSTGSIGVNTLKVIDRYPEYFEVVGLTANNNRQLLESQIRKFKPRHVSIGLKGIDHLHRNFQRKSLKIWSLDDIADMAVLSEVDVVVLGIQGAAALLPFLKAVQAGKIVAPANKEALVMAGHLIMKEARKSKAVIIPIDSEQSAIFQCLQKADRQELAKVYLTASGGPLRHVSQKDFHRLSVSDVLSHPRWKMGKKITVDSATLMNKGLEVIEARWLFNLTMREIDVVIHPEAIIHSMVEFRDGSIIAQLGVTDMRIPIQYALSYPKRLSTGLEKLDLIKLQKLTFEKPDIKKFPALELCYTVGLKGETFPCVLNAANEEGVHAFLNGKIPFNRIVNIVEKVVSRHVGQANPTLSDIWAADQWAREEAQRYIHN